MKPIAKKSNKTAAFTIIELLTIMSIIVILISLLVPALSKVKRYAKRVRQKAQFHSIGVAMNLFNAEFDGYPDSEELDSANPQKYYCGAMKLAEAMVGQDLLGFHPDSSFRNDLTDGTAATAYLYGTPSNGYVPDPPNLLARKGRYIELENANAYRLYNIYGVGNTVPLEGERYVLCDVYKQVRLQPASGNDPIRGKSGMPILYYKANTSKTEYDVINENNPQNIYDYMDNDELVQLGIPFEPSTAWHLMDSTGQTTRHDTPYDISDAIRFYENTINENITVPTGRPYRSESYLLLSAGFDGEYGTPDDVFNFEKGGL